MTRWDTGRLKSVVEVARGSRAVDLCIRNVRLINVFTGTVQSVDLAVHDGLVIGWGSYRARNEIDAMGWYACPGFIDGHIHIKSTMLSPAQFCAAVLPWGTTAVVADPHEIANVHGLDGIRYFLEATEKLPVEVFFRLPSCVPATHLETAGANLRASDLRAMLPHERLIGLAEMMNFPGVIFADLEVLDKLVTFQDQTIDGHAPLLKDLDLNAYLIPGILSDHECTSLPEAREKLAKGMYIMIREGSQSKDLSPLLPLIDDNTWPQCMFVSDDRHPDDLLREGHMNFIVNRAVSLGLDPVRAITLATLTPARYAGLRRQGAIAPGFQADLTLSPTLTPWKPLRVFKKGVEVARDGQLLMDMDTLAETTPPTSPMNISRLSAEDLHVTAQGKILRVIGVQEGTLLTRRLLMPAKIENGRVVVDVERDILKLAVYNRYIPDRVPAVGFVHGTGLKRGAIATTVAHDSHNLIVAGTSDDDIIAVVDALRKAGGGMAAGAAGEGVRVLALSVGGLMSRQPLREVVEELDALKALARSLGSSLRNPFMALSFLALPVIPELKLTDKGLVDVSRFSPVSLFES